MNTNEITLYDGEELTLIQVWVYRRGTGSVRILAGDRDRSYDIKVDPKKFLDFIREQTQEGRDEVCNH